MPSLSTNSTTTLRCEVRDKDTDDLVNPESIECVWWLGRKGSKTTVAQSEMDNPSTGVFTVDVVPEDPTDSGIASGVVGGGAIHLHYEFPMVFSDGRRYTERGKVALSTSEFCG